MAYIFVCGDFRAKDSSKVQIHSELQKKIKNAVFSICNFEAPIKSEGKKIKKSGPSIYQDINAPQLLIETGFNVFLLANNHIMDYGRVGCQNTINAFGDKICIGAGTAEKAYKIKIIEVKGKRIGIFSLVQHEFGCVNSKSDNDGYGTAWINSLDIRDIIIETKANVDFLMVFPHAGVEHVDAPLPEWRLLYRKMIDWGVDAIIGSHPHVPQGWEIYKGKYIFYSLGNFYFDELKGGKYWNKSIAVEIEISDTLQYIMHNIVFYDDGQICMNDNDNEIKEHIDFINKLIADESAYNKYIDDICIEHFEGIKYNLLRGVGGFSLKIKPYYAIRLLGLMIIHNIDEMHLLNIFQNESHRWLAERYLRLKDKIVS